VVDEVVDVALEVALAVGVVVDELAAQHMGAALGGADLGQAPVELGGDAGVVVELVALVVGLVERAELMDGGVGVHELRDRGFVRGVARHRSGLVAAAAVAVKAHQDQQLGCVAGVVRSDRVVEVLEVRAAVLVGHVGGVVGTVHHVPGHRHPQTPDAEAEELGRRQDIGKGVGLVAAVLIGEAVVERGAGGRGEPGGVLGVFRVAALRQVDGARVAGIRDAVELVGRERVVGLGGVRVGAPTVVEEHGERDRLRVASQVGRDDRDVVGSVGAVE
jgi:hypothetical protein